MKEVLPKAIIVASISAEFDRLKAMNIALDVLQRQPDLDIIYAANDTMALGAAKRYAIFIAKPKSRLSALMARRMPAKPYSKGE